jgi:hypothetical protein
MFLHDDEDLDEPHAQEGKPEEKEMSDDEFEGENKESENDEEYYSAGEQERKGDDSKEGRILL